MGEVFAGRYELIDPIGEVGMGTVWRARDLRHDRVVAAKPTLLIFATPTRCLQ